MSCRYLFGTDVSRVSAKSIGKSKYTTPKAAAEATLVLPLVVNVIISNYLFNFDSWLAALITCTVMCTEIKVCHWKLCKTDEINEVFKWFIMGIVYSVWYCPTYIIFSLVKLCSLVPWNANYAFVAGVEQAAGFGGNCLTAEICIQHVVQHAHINELGWFSSKPVLRLTSA